MRHRQKGKRGEYEVRDLIAPWWQQLEPDAEFATTPLSGGWRGSVAVRHDLRLAGDLMTNSKRFPFTIEVKRRERWCEERLLAGKTSPIWGWWRQCQLDADAESGEPMLWFRKNRQPWSIILRAEYAWQTIGTVDSESVSRGAVLLVDVGFIGAQPVILQADAVLAMPPVLFARQ